jgi:hypothetical protein
MTSIFKSNVIVGKNLLGCALIHKQIQIRISVDMNPDSVSGSTTHGGLKLILNFKLSVSNKYSAKTWLGTGI